MGVYNIAEAKAQLSKLVAMAEAGEEVVIARAGRPLVRLEGLTSCPPRELGQLRGLLSIPEDFDAPMDAEELSAWE